MRADVKLVEKMKLKTNRYCNEQQVQSYNEKKLLSEISSEGIVDFEKSLSL